MNNRFGTKIVLLIVFGILLSNNTVFCAARFASGAHATASPAAPLEAETKAGNPAVNRMTDMVQAICRRVKDLRDKSITIKSDDTKSVEEAKSEIQALETPMLEYQTFINDQKRAVPDFINHVNNEGMPPRVIEVELELSLRHDLEAISMTLGLGTFLENKDVDDLQSLESEIYDAIENLTGPVLKFKNLVHRYGSYRTFLQENKKYTQQESHVILHIATYVSQVTEALALADKDGGRYLFNLLKTYVEWLPEATHMRGLVEEVEAHGSLMGIADKNNRTMLDWTRELIETVKKKRAGLSATESSTIFFDDAINQLLELARILKHGLTKKYIYNKETGKEEAQLKKIETRSFAPSTKINPKTGQAYRSISTRIKALDLATHRKDLGEVADTAGYELNEEFYQRLPEIMKERTEREAAEKADKETENLK